MNLIQAQELHELIKLRGWTSGLQYILRLKDGKPRHRQPGEEAAKQVVSAFFYALLDSGKYQEAAILAWGTNKFNPNPKEVQDIWRCCMTYPIGLFLGASSLGKSFNLIIFILLDWARDPVNTNYKIISASETHAKANVWSTLTSYHESSLIPLPGKAGSESIRLTTTDLQAAISLVAIPQGEDGKGRLQGFHPLPRDIPHPVFGDLTRVGAFVDEAEKAPVGIWEGLDNMLSSQTPEHNVRIFGATNPADITSIFAQRSEPPKGWAEFDEDKDFEWESNFGYHVLRLDAKYSENVIQGKTVFRGLQTYEGFMALEKQGITSPNYMTFGRGAYPRENIEYAIIVPAYLKDARQDFMWTGMPFNIGSFDGAFAPGGDKPMLTVGRAGMAIGTRSGTRFNKPKFCCMVDQQIAIPKKPALLMADDLIQSLRMLHIRPEWFSSDSTGNGLLFNQILTSKFGDILNVQWAGETTDKPMVEDNALKANERYKDLVSEMWFAMAIWLEYGYLKFSHLLDTRALFTQLTTRRSKQGNPYRVEAKDTYRARTKAPSPDEADSLAIFIHLCRVRGLGLPSVLPDLKGRTGLDFLGENNMLACAKGGDKIYFMDI